MAETRNTSPKDITAMRWNTHNGHGISKSTCSTNNAYAIIAAQRANPRKFRARGAGIINSGRFFCRFDARSMPYITAFHHIDSVLTNIFGVIADTLNCTSRPSYVHHAFDASRR